MQKSNDIKTQEFIDSIKFLDDTQYQILEKVREIVFEIHPGMKEKMMYGGIIFSLSDDVAGVFVYKNHVSVEFSLGYMFRDPKKLLEGGGKYRRHIKLRSWDEIEAKQLAFFVKQLTEVDN